jgi:hypothetical protein
LEKRYKVAYQLELSPQLLDVHDVFHVSQLKKCLRVPEKQILMEDLDAIENLSYRISSQDTRNNRESYLEQEYQDVQGAVEPSSEENATWEREEEFKAGFLNFFSNLSESRGRDSF